MSRTVGFPRPAASRVPGRPPLGRASDIDTYSYAQLVCMPTHDIPPGTVQFSQAIQKVLLDFEEKKGNPQPALYCYPTAANILETVITAGFIRNNPSLLSLCGLRLSLSQSLGDPPPFGSLPVVFITTPSAQQDRRPSHPNHQASYNAFLASITE